MVVVATTKVHIFKQITTNHWQAIRGCWLLLLPQRYIFSSKSQQPPRSILQPFRCCCYHKGTYFQANHNILDTVLLQYTVVVATTKVHIFKQITTPTHRVPLISRLLLLPQRYIFSSKSQRNQEIMVSLIRCCCYHKGTYFQANHNTKKSTYHPKWLLLLPQRYIFSSKSQLQQQMLH